VTQSVTSTVNGATVTNSVNVNNVGGLLNTGTIQAQSGTNSQTVTSAGTTTATALYVGPFATISRIDVKAEAISGSSSTAGKIVAAVGGIGQGSAFGVILGANSNVPVINVGLGGSIVAQVSTNTFAPTSAIATSSSPFSLVSEAISGPRRQPEVHQQCRPDSGHQHPANSRNRRGDQLHHHGHRPGGGHHRRSYRQQ
jgi:hypothetical protein